MAGGGVGSRLGSVLDTANDIMAAPVRAVESTLGTGAANVLDPLNLRSMDFTPPEQQQSQRQSQSNQAERIKQEAEEDSLQELPRSSKTPEERRKTAKRIIEDPRPQKSNKRRRSLSANRQGEDPILGGSTSGNTSLLG